MTHPAQPLRVGAPLRGWCASLDDSPDPVFRGRMLGDGVSIDPTAGEVRAPFDAEVVTLPESRHAVNLRADNGAEFLVHVGIDTVKLRGDGFEAHVRAGDRVRAGQLLLSFDLEKLLRMATSLRTPVLLLQSEGFSVQQIRPPGLVEPGEVIFEVHTVAPAEGAFAALADAGTEATLTRTVRIGLAHGIHARPAAGLIEAVSGLDARVRLEYRGQAADVRSAVGLMSLGTHRGDTVTVAASGPHAQRALDAVVAGLEPIGDDGAPVEIAPADSPDSERGTPAAPPAGSVLRAVSASPGLGRGIAFPLRRHATVVAGAAGSPEEERASLAAAVERVRAHLRAQAEAGGTGAEIARAHLALLDDPLVADRARQHLDDGLAAGAAWRAATGEAAGALARVDDPRVRERVDDLEDIDLRVQRALAGEDPGRGPDLPPNAVVLADNLLPSQLLELDRDRLAGICLAAGGATAHVAILALSLRIPMLVAAGLGVLGIAQGTDVLVDADLGELHVAPQAPGVERFVTRIEAQARRRASEAEGASLPCVTRDGVRVHVQANIGSAGEAEAAVAAGAEGCGLLRTEFVFMRREHAPGAEDQLQVYREIAAALGDRPLVIRTLDAGGDKPIAYLRQAPEENPALGVRGIRLSLAHPDLLETQLRAVSRLQHPQPVRVMLPMISSVEEVAAARAILARVGTGGAAPIQLGVMIETPAAALIADRLAERVDFFSIGTNDLAQYTLCMDRGEPALADRLDALHPAVLRLIRQAAEAAERAGIPVAVCGGAAGDPLAAPVLLGLGIRELSMPAALIAARKAQLRQFSAADCRRLAAAVLEMDSADAVRAHLRACLFGADNLMHQASS